ncbi:TonB-dependent receptor [Sphingomonas sp. DBB INV C78]|uniref:TonB-dependent receptor n=1 Tax=Sphingomonas sp. DBB INV C78 TaxID=3349434 RepID=UPI0036D21656
MIVQRAALLASGALLYAVSANTNAIAQSSTQPAGAAAQQANEDLPPAGLADIVVTARRTSEALQDTPVAVSAFSQQFLETQNVQQIGTIAQFTPNLVVNEQPSSTTAASFFIRGIGQTEPSSVAEAGVGLYLDGVYIARTAGAVFDLVDLERIEVLRGPQGTLFGRNTVGGAIQLVSKRPTNEFGVEAKGGYASFDEWYAKGAINTGYLAGLPIKAMLSFMHRERDGYVDNLLTPDSKDPGALNSDAVWLTVRGEFGQLTADYTFDYNHRVGVPPFFQTIAASSDAINYYGRSPQFGGAPYAVGSERLDEGQQAGFVDRFGNYRFDARSKTKGHSLILEYEANSLLTLKSITAHRSFFQDTTEPLTGNGELKGIAFDPTSPTLTSVQSVIPFTGNNAPQKQHQFSQEFQAIGDLGDWNYLIGAFYFHEKASEDNRQALTLVTTPAGLVNYGFPTALADAVAALNPGLDLIGINAAPVQAFGGTSESMAVFGQVSWRPAAVDDRLELTGGLRYTWDYKTIELRGDVQPSVSGHADYTNFSWLGSVSYKLIDEVMAYARVSTGYKSGGFNPRAAILNRFDPEQALAYEAGLKAEWFDRRLRTNLAVFYTDYDDLQVQQFASGSSGATTLILNAGKANFKGFELEVVALPFRGVTIDGSLGYVDPKYDSFLFRDPATNQIIDVADEGRFAQVAKTNAHIGVQYDFAEFSFGQLSARVDGSYRSKMYFHPLDRVNPFNEDVAAGEQYTLAARVTLSEISMGPRAKAMVSLWGDNLTDEEDIAFGIDFGGLGYGGSHFRKPRTIGVDFKLSY